MTVCDICEKKDSALFDMRIGTGLIDENYVICMKCRRKLKKYIKFEQARQKGAKQCLDLNHVLFAVEKLNF